MMSKPLPILDQMPWNVKRAIVNSSDNETKTELRRCSKELNEHVKVSKIDAGNFLFKLQCGGPAVLLQHSKGKFEFYPTANGCIKKKEVPVSLLDIMLSAAKGDFKTKDVLTEIDGGDFISTSVEQLMKVFKNQAVHIGSLVIDFDYDPSSDLHKQYASQFTGKLKEELCKLSHQISVRMLHMLNDCDPDQILAILRHIKPSRQFTLAITPMTGGRFLPLSYPAAFSFLQIDLSKIGKTEQWKRAKDVILSLFRVPIDCPETMCIPSMWFNVPNLRVKDVKFIVENITRKDGWQKRTFTCQNVDESVMEYLGNFRVGQRGQGYDYEVPGVNGVPCYIHVKDWGRSEKKLWFHSYSERPKNYYW